MIGAKQTPETVYLEDGTDLNKLAIAVAHAETANCTRGSGISYNNAIGMMHWDNGYRELKRYNSCEESLEDFKRVWKEHYKKYPTIKEAIKWTGGDKPTTWLNIVNKYYES